MAHGISTELLSQLSEFVTAHLGLFYPAERWADLQRGLRAAARDFDFDDSEECARWLLSAPLSQRQIEILASHLTVGETYFWREKKSFEVLEEQILPEIIRARRESALSAGERGERGERHLRLWSAGCCTGEEAYSLAILLRRLLPDVREWNLTILATDINPRFLQKAATGVYGQWSFRDAPPWLKERYFRVTREGRFEIVPEIKQMVSFAYLNLVEDAYPSLLNNTNAMDVIFCRNVLMYLSPAQAQKVVGNFYNCLVEDGYLCVSPSETSHLLFSRFAAAQFPGASFYRKQSALQPKTRPAETPFSWKPSPEAVSIAPLAPPLQPAHRLQTPPAKPQPKVEAPKVAAPKVAAPQMIEAPPTLQAARTLHEQGRYGEAVELLEKLAGHEPGNAQALSLLARSHANRGQLAQALERCEQALAADKLNAGYYYLRATILQEQGADDQAVQSLKRALYLDHDFVLAHFALGNLIRRQGKPKEAARHFANTLQLLHAYGPEDILPESEGITAGRLAAITAAMTEEKAKGGRP